MIAGEQCGAPQDTIARIMGMSTTGSMSTIRCVYMHRACLGVSKPSTLLDIVHDTFADLQPVTREKCVGFVQLFDVFCTINVHARRLW